MARFEVAISSSCMAQGGGIFAELHFGLGWGGAFVGIFQVLEDFPSACEAFSGENLGEYGIALQGVQRKALLEGWVHGRTTVSAEHVLLLAQGVLCQALHRAIARSQVPGIHGFHKCSVTTLRSFDCCW